MIWFVWCTVCLDTSIWLSCPFSKGTSHEMLGVNEVLPLYARFRYNTMMTLPVRVYKPLFKINFSYLSRYLRQLCSEDRQSHFIEIQFYQTNEVTKHTSFTLDGNCASFTITNKGKSV